MYADFKLIFLSFTSFGMDCLIIFLKEILLGPTRSIILFENFGEFSAICIQEQTSPIDIGCNENFPESGISTCFLSICLEIFFVR